MTNQKTLGQLGEEIALKYLTNHNYQIVTTNVHIGHKEIDIIGIKNGKIVCFEIKTRQIRDIEPDDCLTVRQINHLKAALRFFCFKNHLNLEMAQGDLIIVLINHPSKEAKIKHYFKIF